MICCQKVGRLKHIRAVPPLKVGRLEPSHGDRFRRQWVRTHTNYCSQICKLHSEDTRLLEGV